MLEQLGLAILEVDEDGVLFVDLIDFDIGAASLEPNLGASEISRDHLHGAVVAETEKDAGGEKDFGLAVSRGNDLTGLHLGMADRFGGEGTALDGGLSFNVIKSSWASWVRALPEGGRAQSRQGKN